MCSSVIRGCHTASTGNHEQGQFLSELLCDATCHADDVDCASLQLCDLYENDCIFDKFDCCVSGDGTRLATGSYSNLFKASLIPAALC